MSTVLATELDQVNQEKVLAHFPKAKTLEDNGWYFVKEHGTLTEEKSLGSGPTKAAALKHVVRNFKL